MTMADSDKMLEWKNYSETRQFAIQSHDEIKREDHLKWLEKNLQYFQVIEAFNGKEMVGAIRIQDGEVSIWVDREFRKCKVATGILITGTNYGMTAKIVDGNVGSMRAFIRAGFLPIDHVDNYYTLKKQ